MPTSTLPYLRSLTPASHRGADLEVHAIDEYVQTDLEYLDLIDGSAHSLVSRFAARKSEHGEASMEFSAGVRRLTRDRVEDYLGARRARYGFELAPLPRNLTLSKHDQELNRNAKLRFAEGPLRLAVSSNSTRRPARLSKPSA